MPDPPAAALIVRPADPLLADDAPRPASQDPRLVYLASLATEKGRRAQRGALDTAAEMLCQPTQLHARHGTRRCADALPWAALRYQHLQVLRAKLLEERYAPATINRTLCAVRGVLREAMRLELISAEDCTRACDVKSVKGRRLPAGRALTQRELRALFEVCDRETTKGLRDAALLAVLYSCGLRREEAVTVDLADYDPADRALRVRGKGNKERLVYIVAGADTALDAWLARRGSEAGPLFLPVHRTGKVSRRRLSDQAVYLILQGLAATAKVNPFGAHDIRRTTISDLLDEGADLATVQQLAGHEQITTTAKYDRRPERARRRAAHLLRVPIGDAPHARDEDAPQEGRRPRRRR